MMQFCGKGTLARPGAPWIPAYAGMTVGVRRNFAIVLGMTPLPVIPTVGRNLKSIVPSRFAPGFFVVRFSQRQSKGPAPPTLLTSIFAPANLTPTTPQDLTSMTLPPPTTPTPPSPSIIIGTCGQPVCSPSPSPPNTAGSPPANDRCLETVGKIACGLDAFTVEIL